MQIALSLLFFSQTVLALVGTLNPTQDTYYDQYQLSDWNSSFYITIESKYVPASFQYFNQSIIGVNKFHIFSMQAAEITSSDSSYVFLTYLIIDGSLKTIIIQFEMQTQVQKYIEKFTVANNNYEGYWYSLEIRNDAIQNTLNVTFYQNTNKSNIFQKIYTNQCLLIDNRFSFYLGDSKISRALKMNQIQGPIKYQIMTQTTKFSPQTQTCSSNSGYALRSVANYTKTTFYEFQIKTITSRSYGIQTWIKINQNVSTENNYVNVIHIQQNPIYDYQQQIGGKLLNILYQINSTKQIVSIIYQSYTFPIVPSFINGKDPLERQTSFEVPKQYSLYEYHYLGFSYRNNILQVQIQFPKLSKIILQTINNVFQFSDLYLILHFGGTKFNYSNNDGQFITPYFYTCLTTFAPVCQITCATCFGPQFNQCLTCSVTSNRVLSSDNKCICKLGFLDTNITACYQAIPQRIENIIPLSTKIGYDQEINVVCSYGYFKYDDECYQCPKLNNRYFCPECIQYPNTWVYNPICSNQYGQFNKSENNTFTQDVVLAASFDIMALDPYDVYTFNYGELQFCTHCNQLCLTPPFDNYCQDSKYQHLEQNIKVICDFNGLMINQQCEFCPTLCLRCGYINGSYLCLERTQLPIKNASCITYSGTGCLDCSDYSKFYMNIEQKYCFACTIVNCKYCFQYHSQNINFNSLFPTSNIEYQQEDLMVGCALCIRGFIYNFLTGKCESNMMALGSNCTLYYINKQNTPVCLISNTFASSVAILNCYQFLANCMSCIQPTINQYYCIQCDSGYYLNRVYGNCYLCNDYNSLYYECQQETLQRQNYKYEVIPQMFSLTKKYYNAVYQQNLGITLISCISGYANYNQACISSSNINCQSFNAGCQTCNPTLEGTKRLTIINLMCSDCPYYCEYCKPRLLSEVQAVNPYLNYTLLPASFLPYRCIMKSSTQANLFFDNEQQLVRICTPNVPKCQMEFQIIFTSFSSLATFLIQASPSNYLYYNLKSVNGFFLLVNTTASYTLSNSFLGLFEYQNIQIQQVVSLKYVKLHYMSNGSSIIFGKLQFRDYQYFNFTNVTLLFSFTQNSFISFLCIKEINFLLMNATITDTPEVPKIFQQTYDQSDPKRSYSIIINNAVVVELINVIIANISLINTTFINIKSVNQVVLDHIILQNVTFQNCSFFKTSIITFTKVNQFKSIILKNINFINCTFQNSYFLESEEFLFNGIFSFSDILIDNCNFIQSNVLVAPKNDLIQISNFIARNSIFQSTTILTVSSSTTIAYFTITNCTLIGSVLITKQKNLFLSVIEEYLFTNILITDNKYMQTSVIQIYQSGSEQIFINLENLKYSSLNLLTEDAGVSFDYFFFYFEGYSISLNILELIRQPGQRDFSLFNFTYVNINDVQIKSCIKQQVIDFESVNKYTLNIVFQISTLIFKMSNVTITNQFAVDKTFIQISDRNHKQINLNSTIEISNLYVENIQMIKTTSQDVTTIISITSQITQNIVFYNCSFTGVWLNEYLSDPKISSAALAVINSEQGSLLMEQIYINKTLVTNSSNSNFLILVDFLNVKSLYANHINIINEYKEYYGNKLLMNVSIVNLDQLSVYSLGGLGYLQVQQFNVTDSLFHNLIGLEGGVFSITTQKNGFVNIQNCSFINTSTSQNDKLEGRGGSIFLDSENSYLNLNIKNTNFTNSTSGYEGGVIYCKPSFHYSLLSFQNLNFLNVFALHFSVIYFWNIEISTSSLITMDGIFVQNGFANQRDYFTKYSYSLSSLQINETSSMFSFSGWYQYKLFSQIQLKNVFITGFTIQPLFYLQFIGLLQMQNIRILNLTQATNQLIYINNIQSNNLLILDYQSKLIINGLYIEDVKNSNHEEYMSYQERLASSKITLILINFYDFQTSVTFSDFMIVKTNCEICNTGLLSVNLSSLSTVARFLNFHVMNNHCGIQSCIYLQGNGQTHKIIQSKFLNNTANNGGAIYVKNIKLLFIDSLFIKNYASASGGAVYYENQQYQLQMRNIYFIKNQAQRGGAIYDQNIQNTENYRSVYFLDNKVTQYGANIATQPSKLSLIMNGEKLFQNQRKIGAKLIDEITYLNSNNSISQFIYLPSGSSLKQYQRFNTTSLTFINDNISLVIKAYNFLNEQQFDLNNTDCQLDSQRISQQNTSSDPSALSSTYIQYDEQSNLYNLGNLAIKYNPYLDDKNYLQIEVSCDSILENNYFLRFYVKTYKCQIGEYYSNDQCIECDAKSGYYSVEKQSTQCQRIDIKVIKSTTGAMIQMQPGYWRPAYRSDKIEECIKYSSRCLGGWNVSDATCAQGAIGALCEQCDLYNTRGDESYLNARQLMCSKCGNQYSELVIAFFEALWSVLLVILTVRSLEYSNKQLFKLKCIYKNYGALSKQLIDQTSIFIKIANNTFQIISVIYTFQITVFDKLSNVLLFLGDSSYIVTYQLDCWIPYLTYTSYEYSHFIMILILPMFQFALCCLTYFILLLKFKLSFTKTYIFSSIIYLYCLNYQYIVKWGISLITKRSISGIDWIQANIANRFDTEIHQQWSYRFIYPILLFFGIVIPLFLYSTLRLVRDKLDHKAIRQKYSFLYNEYQKSSYYWEIFRMFQKLLITLIVNYFEQLILFKGIIIFLIVVFYEQLCQKHQPYLLSSLNKIDVQSSFLSSIIIIMSLLLYVIQTEDQSSYIDDLIQIVIFIFILKLFEVLLRRILRAYFTNLNMKFDVIRLFIMRRFPFLLTYQILKPILNLKRDQQERIQIRFRKLRQYLKSQIKQQHSKAKTVLLSGASSIISPKLEIQLHSTMRQLMTDREAEKKFMCD